MTTIYIIPPAIVEKLVSFTLAISIAKVVELNVAATTQSEQVFWTFRFDNWRETEVIAVLSWHGR